MADTHPARRSARTPRESMQEVHARMLRGTAARSRDLDLGAGRRVHVIEAGEGPPVLHLHGTSTSSLSHLPLIERMPEARSIAVDRPGCGLSEPRGVGPEGVREAAVRFVAEVMDALALPAAVLAGGSMGGTWSVWYALAHPERVSGVALLGAAPLLPGTRPPAPLRLMATPVVGDVLQRLARPSRSRVIRLMSAMGEGDSIARHPDLLDSLVAAGRDPTSSATTLAELRTIITPLGFRTAMRVRTDELRRLAVPTLMVWGDHDPVGTVDAAQTTAALVPHARLEVLAAGHVPWLTHPGRVARLLLDFIRETRG